LNREDNYQVCKLVAEKPTGLSRAMHNAAFRAMKLKFRYELLDTSDTAWAISEMRSQNLRGYSLTIPHKEAALELIDKVDSAALEVGAVNTVVNDGQVLRGYNTDVYGVQRALEEVREISDFKRVLVLGAGGAARAALQVFKTAGVSEVFVTNRTYKRAEKLAEDFECRAVPLEQSFALNSTCDLLINSTPLGSHLADDSQNDLSVRLTDLPETAVVFDMVTREQTRLLELARSQGLKTVSGPRMLLHQAVQQFELFTETASAPLEKMEKALYQELEAP